MAPRNNHISIISMDEEKQKQEFEEFDNLNNFDEAFDRLEEITGRLESGGSESDELKLDEAIDLYREGVELVQGCRERLDEAEAKLEVLNNDDTSEKGD
ncbi:MAG: exodeoxyribonuclease VII small subunit [Halobacteria archaeon]|nr:exodeoxyribonuclease VII small subunit [Halobacteria archaeon]